MTLKHDIGTQRWSTKMEHDAQTWHWSGALDHGCGPWPWTMALDHGHGPWPWCWTGISTQRACTVWSDGHSAGLKVCCCVCAWLRYHRVLFSVFFVALLTVCEFNARCSISNPMCIVQCCLVALLTVCECNTRCICLQTRSAKKTR